MDHPKVLLQPVANAFEDLVGRLGQHGVVAGDEVYLQPPVYLSLHLVQMRAAGWTDIDFDDLAVVSGGSALFGYEPGEFMPKYANLWIGMDRRIADASGFGYEWVDFRGADAAWTLVKESVDAGRSLKGWDWENILFAGYQEAADAGDRRVFAMADGPGTVAGWFPWEDFLEWAERTEGWNLARLGRHTTRVETRPAGEVARRVMKDLVAWSSEPPAVVHEKYPNATFGLAGIEAYAAACEDVDRYKSVTACHDINGQWAVRNSTSVYLKRVADAGVFGDEVTARLHAAAKAYRAAYECWQELYRLLGHGATEAERRSEERRLNGSAAVRQGLEHERAGLAEIERALALLG